MSKIVQWAEQTLYYPNLNGKLDKLQLFPYQRDIISQIEQNKFTVVCTPKRQGKTMISAVVSQSHHSGIETRISQITCHSVGVSQSHHSGIET